MQDLIAVYADLARRSDYALHLGLTEAGMGSKGIVASAAGDGHAAAAGHRRHHPHFAHARARRRSHAGGEGRAGTVADHGLPHVRAAGRGLSRLRPHHLDDVPGTRARHPGLHPRRRCRSGRSAIPASRRSTSRSWAASSTGRARCKHADIGISLPGTGEQPAAPVFIDGKKAMTLRGPTRRGGFQETRDRLYRAPLRPRRGTHCGGVAGHPWFSRLATVIGRLAIRCRRHTWFE